MRLRLTLPGYRHRRRAAPLLLPDPDGMAMRGVLDNRDLIGLFGGRPARRSTLSWATGTSLASVAGILVAPRLQLRSLPMTFFGALVVGLASSYALGYLPSSGIWAFAPIQGLLTPLGALGHPVQRPAGAAHAPDPPRRTAAPRPARPGQLRALPGRVLPVVRRLRLRRLRPGPPARPLRPQRELGQGLHGVPGRGPRTVLHRHPGPAPGHLPGPGRPEPGRRGPPSGSARIPEAAAIVVPPGSRYH